MLPLADSAPALHQRLQSGLHQIYAACARHTAGRQALPGNYWRAHPPLLRLAAGFCQMWLENQQGSRQQQEHLLHGLETALHHI